MLAILVINRAWFLHSSLELGMFLRRNYFFIVTHKTTNKCPSELMFTTTLPAEMVVNRVLNFWSGHNRVHVAKNGRF